jgi:hypothetical protein
MAIEAMIKKNTPQTAVYWQKTGDNGEGGYIFAAPVELKPPNGVRWEETKQATSDNKGNEVTSRAVIYLNQDVVEESMIYLGTLDSLYDIADSSAGAVDDPKVFANTWIIKRFVKTPALHSTTEFLRVAYLTPSLSFGGF